MKQDMAMDPGGFWDCADSAEDDVFYEELRRQVLLLTAEDDDDDDEECRGNKHPDAAKSLQKGFSSGPVSALLPPGCYYHYHWSGFEAKDSGPRWPSSLRNPGSGTGVFIPQVTKSRRRYKPRKRSQKGRTCKPVADAVAG